MSFYSNIINRLNSPFPASESFKDDLKGLVIAGLIVSTILFVFKPFGLSNYKGSHLYIAALFGLTSIVSGLIVNVVALLFIKTPYNRPNFKLKNWIFEILILLCAIAMGNVILTSFLYNSPINLEQYLYMLLSTVLLGIFPVVFFGLKKQIQLEKSHASEASTISETISEPKENPEPIATPKPSEVILAVESMQNYIHIYKVSGDELIKETERKTLKIALEELRDHQLTKCHRSYLVNLNEVINVSGNAQGLKLTMSHKNCPQISVSRSFITAVKSRLA